MSTRSRPVITPTSNYHRIIIANRSLGSPGDVRTASLWRRVRRNRPKRNTRGRKKSKRNVKSEGYKLIAKTWNRRLRKSKQAFAAPKLPLAASDLCKCLTVEALGLNTSRSEKSIGNSYTIQSKNFVPNSSWNYEVPQQEEALDAAQPDGSSLDGGAESR